MKFLVSLLFFVICLTAMTSATEKTEEKHVEEKHTGGVKEKRGLLHPVAYAPTVVRAPILPPPAVVAHAIHPPPAFSVSAYGYHQVHPGYAYTYFG